MLPMKNELHRYSYCTNRLRKNLYMITKTFYPEEWKRSLGIMHSHDFPQIWYCLNGEITIILPEKEYKLRPGQILILPISQLHQIKTPEETVAEIFNMEIRYNIFDSAPNDKYLNAKKALFLPAFLRKYAPEPISLGKASKRILHESLSKLSLNSLSQVSEKETWENLENIFSLPELLEEPIKKEHIEKLWQEKVVPIFKVLDYVNENYNEKLLSADMLRISTMGYSTFFSTFKKILRISFVEYVQQLRLLNCHLLFSSTTYSMATIATLCGFSNQSHMERTYKKFAGVLPKQARRHSHEWINAHPGNKLPQNLW